DAGLHARSRQQHADFQGTALGAQDRGRSNGGGGGGGAGQKVAAVGQHVGAIHGNILPGFGEMLGNCCGGGKHDQAAKSCAVAAAMRSSRWSWPLRATNISPTGSLACSGSEMAQRSKKLMIEVLRSTAALRAAKVLPSAISAIVGCR